MKRRQRIWILITVVFLLGIAVIVASKLPGCHHRMGTVVGVADDALISWADCYKNARGEMLYYRLLPPAGYADPARKRYPLLITLHGDGCAGTDNLKQLTCIVPTVSTAAFRHAYPCFVLAPQCPPDSYWVAKRCYTGSGYRLSAQPSPAIRLLLELLPTLLTKYPIDAQRIYVMGYSSGATGAWDLITRRPELFAAAVPLCGRGDPQQARRISHMPIWVVHGARDRIVGCSCARVMVRALSAQGGSPHYTEYPDAGHEAGMLALNDRQLFAWLFSQRRNNY